MDSEENQRDEEHGEPQGRSVTGILLVIAATLILVIAMQMCQ